MFCIFCDFVYICVGDKGDIFCIFVIVFCLECVEDFVMFE